jgi:NADH-quinone oxidoreductase subunit C
MITLSGDEIARQITAAFPDSAAAASDGAILVKADSVFKVAEFLRTNPELDLDYLNYLTAVDYYDYFEVVYQLTSIKHNHTVVLKTRCYDRNNPVVPSVVGLWRGADFQEREVYDLMGITFQGHPDLRRIMLWEGFEGHPLRKDYNGA